MYVGQDYSKLGVLLPCITKLARHNRLFGNFKFAEVFFLSIFIYFYVFQSLNQKENQEKDEGLGRGRKEGGKGG